MRAKLIELAAAHGKPVRQSIVTRSHLEQASAVWLTNSLIGLRPVAQHRERGYDTAAPELQEVRAHWQKTFGWDPVVIAPTS